MVELKSGDLVVLCRTPNGTYVKTSDGNLLDATNTIYDFHIGKNIKIKPKKLKQKDNSAQRFPLYNLQSDESTDLTASPSNKVETNKQKTFNSDEVIELD